VNIFIESILENILKDYSIIWQIGSNELYRDFERINKTINNLSKDLRGGVYITKYVGSEIGFILDKADYVISRPGANTLYELAVLGKRAILIPLWVTSRSDQYQNADWYSSKFVGTVIKENELSVEQIYRAIFELDSHDSPTRKLDFIDPTNLIIDKIFS
jgi:UDP-N-acetylglucosamine--N-acetylmuramyl-(pentapeptide) pyrophosphoryl-undecaprenol N-acetylglucosamine transferase